jgi:hypothetical protein
VRPSILVTASSLPRTPYAPQQQDRPGQVDQHDDRPAWVRRDGAGDLSGYL